MDLGFLLRGVVLGFAIAAPVGPIGVLCIRRTLANGRVNGLVSGLGAATADASYGAVAAFGLTAVSSLLLSQRVWIHLIGAIFLAYLGIRTLLARSAPLAQASTTTSAGLAVAYASTVALTLANPATIISFAAVFAGLGVAGSHASYAAAGLLVLGVFCGSALWWVVLSSGVNLLRARVTPRLLRGVNVLSGVILLAFAVVSLLTANG
jgi:threonine/homoserine/homoserine lactone efflux protein